MIHPHGGTLINKELPSIEKEPILKEASEFEKISVNNETLKEIKNISFGVFSPLEGFMIQNDFENVLEHSYPENNIAQSLPIVLYVSEKELENINIDDRIILVNSDQTSIALMDIEDIYAYDKKPKEVLDKLYQSSRITLIPSFSTEAFGWIIIESILNGTPVITSPNCGANYFLQGKEYVKVIPLKIYLWINSIRETIKQPPIINNNDVEDIYNKFSVMKSRKDFETLVNYILREHQKALKKE